MKPINYRLCLLTLMFVVVLPIFLPLIRAAIGLLFILYLSCLPLLHISVVPVFHSGSFPALILLICDLPIKFE